MFAYLISEVLCNIYQVCISTERKAASLNLLQRLDQEWSLDQSTGLENYLLDVFI